MFIILTSNDSFHSNPTALARITFCVVCCCFGLNEFVAILPIESNWLMNWLQNGKVCCHFDISCPNLRLGLGNELSVQHQLTQHKRHGGTGRIHRASPEGSHPPADAIDQKRGPVRAAKASSTTTETITRSGSRATTGQHARRMSRGARLARSSSSSSADGVKQQRRQSPSNSSPSSATKHNSGSSQVPAVAADSGATKVVSQQESGPPT